VNFIQKALLRIAHKTASVATSDPYDWYVRNGYIRLASSRGYGSINEDRALQSTAVYGCIKTIAEDAGSLPLFVKSRTKDRKHQDKLYDHPLYTILHDQPNPETSAIEFREALTAHAALTGDAYAKIVRDGDRVIAMWQLMPYNVRLKRTQAGALQYVVTENGVPKDYAARDIFHLRGFGITGLKGNNILEYARKTIGLTLDQIDYSQKFFDNDATPGIVLQHPGKLGPEGVKGVKKAWKDAVDSHDVAVTQEGLIVNPIGTTNVEAQLTEQRRFQILEVCRLFRMPPHKLADLERATFSNIEQSAIEYYTNTLRPWLVRWEQTIQRCLLVNEPNVFAEHAIEGLLRGDFKTQTDGFARMLEKGVYAINEVRAYMGLNPVDGGDEHYVQLNMQAVSDALGVDPAIDQQPPAKSRIFRVKSQA